jgi:hypothetical protein
MSLIPHWYPKCSFQGPHPYTLLLIYFCPEHDPLNFLCYILLHMPAVSTLRPIYSSSCPVHAFRRPIGSREGFAFTNFSYIQHKERSSDIPGIPEAVADLSHKERTSEFSPHLDVSWKVGPPCTRPTSSQDPLNRGWIPKPFHLQQN